jgi:hypothetical protein
LRGSNVTTTRSRSDVKTDSGQSLNAYNRFQTDNGDSDTAANRGRQTIITDDSGVSYVVTQHGADADHPYDHVHVAPVKVDQNGNPVRNSDGTYRYQNGGSVATYGSGGSTGGGTGTGSNRGAAPPPDEEAPVKTLPPEETPPPEGMPIE